MAKVAPPGSLSSASFQIGAMKVGSTVKRKTPSELRGEQLKRMNAVEILDESSASMFGSVSEVNYGLKKAELSRNPRYVDTRMDEVYPAKKSRLVVLSGKENTKETASLVQPSSLKNHSWSSDLAVKRKHQLACPENVVNSAEAAKDEEVQCPKTIEKCSQSTFRSVTELSVGNESSSGNLAVDMDKALKGLVACESSDTSCGPAFSSGSCMDHRLSSITSFCLPGQKVPLDFTLKTCMRVQSSSSVSWTNRLFVCHTSTGMPFTSQLNFSGDHNKKEGSGFMSPSQVISSNILHSWVYPQSTLPPSIMSVLTSSAAEGVEMDFIRRRQVTWEDSFRSLYYMFRRSICNIFYVCTAHFVVMFTGHDGFEGTRHLCKAYVSKSTRGFRALLREHDVNFCMPLCRSKIEQVTTEDLVELSEIEKQNLGQTRRQSSLSDIDNSPESLLAFYDKDAHGLYDILLNYRSLLTALVGMDVPVLCSPKPFWNASLSAPEIKCMELKRAEHIAFPDRESITKEGETQQGSSSGFCSTVEIKDAYLPPWVICSLCSFLSSEGKSFEASFTTEATSISLNAAVEAVCEKSDAQAEDSYAFGIPEAVVSPYLRSSSLKGLKYSDASYVATLSLL